MLYIYQSLLINSNYPYSLIISDLNTHKLYISTIKWNYKEYFIIFKGNLIEFIHKQKIGGFNMKQNLKKQFICLITTLFILATQSNISLASTVTLPFPVTSVPSISIPTVPSLPIPGPIYIPSSRFDGNPGDINITNGGKFETHIGNDGKADAERHHTNHGNPKHHENPHDHKIDWINGKPKFTKSDTKLFDYNTLSGNPFRDGISPC